MMESKSIKSIYLHSNTMQEQTSIKMLCKSSPPNKSKQIKHFQFTSKLFNSAATYTMSLLKKFHTLITLNETLYFLQSNLHLFFTKLYA